MNTSIKKGITHINISYTDGDFSHNLYCTEMVLINGVPNSLEMNFKNNLNSRYQTNSNADLVDLISNMASLDEINIQNLTITKKIIKKLKQNEEIIVSLIIDKTYNLISHIVFKSKDEFTLKIIGQGNTGINKN